MNTKKDYSDLKITAYDLAIRAVRDKLVAGNGSSYTLDEMIKFKTPEEIIELLRESPTLLYTPVLDEAKKIYEWLIAD